MIITLAHALVLASAGGVDPAPAAIAQETETRADRVQALIDEFDAAYDEFLKAYRAAEDDEGRRAAFDLQPSPEDFASKLLAVAEEAPEAEAALDAAVWVVQRAETPDYNERALELIQAHHIESEAMGSLCYALSSDTRYGPPVLKAILARNPHEDVRAKACLGLGDLHLDLADSIGTAGDPEALQQAYADAIRYFERVLDEFGEVEHSRRGTFAAAAEPALFQAQNLQFGQVAPDIEGVDTNGVTFKLSDYRGKVVVLDFWGDW